MDACKKWTKKKKKFANSNIYICVCVLNWKRAQEVMISVFVCQTWTKKKITLNCWSRRISLVHSGEWIEMKGNDALKMILFIYFSLSEVATETTCLRIYLFIDFWKRKITYKIIGTMSGNKKKVIDLILTMHLKFCFFFCYSLVSSIHSFSLSLLFDWFRIFILHFSVCLFFFCWMRCSSTVSRREKRGQSVCKRSEKKRKKGAKAKSSFKSFEQLFFIELSVDLNAMCFVFDCIGTTSGKKSLMQNEIKQNNLILFSASFSRSRSTTTQIHFKSSTLTWKCLLFRCRFHSLSRSYIMSPFFIAILPVLRIVIRSFHCSSFQKPRAIDFVAIFQRIRSFHIHFVIIFIHTSQTTTATGAANNKRSCSLRFIYVSFVNQLISDWTFLFFDIFRSRKKYKNRHK